MKELSTMVELTGAELDAVAAGAPLIVVADVVDVGDVNVDVAIPVNAAAAVAVLGTAGARPYSPVKYLICSRLRLSRGRHSSCHTRGL
jgi:hypothetical protein